MKKYRNILLKRVMRLLCICEGFVVCCWHQTCLFILHISCLSKLSATINHLCSLITLLNVVHWCVFTQCSAPELLNSESAREKHTGVMDKDRHTDTESSIMDLCRQGRKAADTYQKYHNKTKKQQMFGESYKCISRASQNDLKWYKELTFIQTLNRWRSRLTVVTTVV